MPRIAQFVVIAASERTFTIPDPNAGPGTERAFQNIQAPNVDAGSHAVLAFKVATIGNGRLKMRINDTPHTIDFAFDDTESASRRSWHEIVAKGVLKPENNELIVSVPTPETDRERERPGKVLISDIALFYQANNGAADG